MEGLSGDEQRLGRVGRTIRRNAGGEPLVEVADGEADALGRVSLDQDMAEGWQGALFGAQSLEHSPGGLERIGGDFDHDVGSMVDFLVTNGVIQKSGSRLVWEDKKPYREDLIMMLEDSVEGLRFLNNLGLTGFEEPENINYNQSRKYLNILESENAAPE